MGKKKAERDDAYRVRRGGCYFAPPEYARVAIRYSSAPGARDKALSFRLVRRRSALEWLADALRGEVNDGQDEG
jgi:formylglycine-generating enzyme required for sulfatase activity